MANDLGDPRNEVAQRFRELRLAADLTQQEAADGLNVDVGTVSRWERGDRAIKASDFNRAKDWFLSVAVARDRATQFIARSGEVPARSSTYLIPADLLESMRHFEREVARLGATDFELDLVHELISADGAISLYHTGGTGSPLTVAEQVDQFKRLAESLWAWLVPRVEARQRSAAPVATGFKRMSSKQLASDAKRQTRKKA